jgi:hypothetical protein
MGRVFGVLFTEQGLSELGPVLKDYLSEGPMGRHLYCKEANPDRNYFHVVAESTNSDGTKIETEIYIPHRFIKAVIAGADRKHIGFV